MGRDICIHDLTKVYKKEVVLNAISHTFRSGQIHGIVGRNGSGKTTLLRLICGLSMATSGEIRIGDAVVNTRQNGAFPTDIGILIDAAGFIPYYSGFRNLEYLANIQKRITRKEIEEAMLLVGLSPTDKKWVGKYSLGMRQRLGIAQAIMESPDILLLDEPMNGLDKEGVADMYVLFRKLRQEGKTILLASHHAEDIELLCDTVIELDHGNLTVVR